MCSDILISNSSSQLTWRSFLWGVKLQELQTKSKFEIQPIYFYWFVFKSLKLRLKSRTFNHLLAAKCICKAFCSLALLCLPAVARFFSLLNEQIQVFSTRSKLEALFLFIQNIFLFLYWDFTTKGVIAIHSFPVKAHYLQAASAKGTESYCASYVFEGILFEISLRMTKEQLQIKCLVLEVERLTRSWTSNRNKTQVLSLILYLF